MGETARLLPKVPTPEEAQVVIQKYQRSADVVWDRAASDALTAFVHERIAAEVALGHSKFNISVSDAKRALARCTSVDFGTHFINEAMIHVAKAAKYNAGGTRWSYVQVAVPPVPVDEEDCCAIL